MSTDNASEFVPQSTISDEQALQAFTLLAEGGNKLHKYIGIMLSDFVIAYNSLVERGQEEKALAFREEVSELFFKKLLNKVSDQYDQGVLRHTFEKKMMELIPIRMEMKQTQVLTSRSAHEPLFIREYGRYEWLTNQGDGGKIARHFGAD
ncbi:MAG: hypothetical protein WCV80_04075 [Candidatus Paceibacterota bacterium]|jgi:hypothetical protein